LLDFLATLCAGLFSGAALYISAVEHPARLAAGSTAALAQFRAGFPRARSLQASLALVGGACALGAWWLGGLAIWLVAAGCLLSIPIITIVVITPVYNQLLDTQRRADDPETAALLEKWGLLHAIRTGLGCTAFAFCVTSMSAAALLARNA